MSKGRLLVEDDKKQGDENLHDSANMINHSVSNMHREIRVMEANQPFVDGLWQSKEKVDAQLKTLALDNNSQSVVAPLHRQNKKFVPDRHLQGDERYAMSLEGEE